MRSCFFLTAVYLATLAFHRTEGFGGKRRRTNKIILLSRDNAPRSRLSASADQRSDDNDDNDDLHDKVQHKSSTKEGLFFLLQQRVDWLQVRLDATVLSIYALGRWIVYDIASGAKAVPGFDLPDIIAISECFSSAILLSLVWTVIGIVVTEELLLPSEETEPSTNTQERLFPLLVTVLISTPAWLLSESLLGFVPPGADAPDEIALLTTTIGLGATIWATKE